MDMKEFAAQAVGRAFPGKGMIPVRDAWVFLGGTKSSVSQLMFYARFPLPRVSQGEGKGIRWFTPAPALAEEYARRLIASGWHPEETAEVLEAGRQRGRPRKISVRGEDENG